MVVLRGHRYRPIGTWQGLPVLATDSTDSMLQDRAVLTHPAVLSTGQSTAPASADGDWPAPVGNVYLCLPRPGAAAIGVVGQALENWLTTHAPGVRWTPSWEGNYGVYRTPAGRTLAGVLVGQDAVGIDVHVRGRYPANSAHQALAELVDTLGPLDAVRRSVLAHLCWPVPRLAQRSL